MLHFKPKDGWVADVIPFSADGRVHLFFLLNTRVAGAGCGWAHISTTDFVSFTDHGLALEPGAVGDPDFNALTGSVIADDDGIVHLFWTADNPTVFDGPAPVQAIMHAVSLDRMESWERSVGAPIVAPAGRYDPADWRDPFVFRVPGEAKWRMVVAARHLDGPEQRRGLLAQLVSENLQDWTLTEPLWDSRRYKIPECPDVFELGGNWYFFFSEYADAGVTRYRLADGPDGPWRLPANDMVDDRGFYAAKSVEGSDGRRFLAGWVPSKEGERDAGRWQWGGDLSVRQVTRRQDGNLGFAFPKTVLDTFDRTVLRGTEPIELQRPDGYGTHTLASGLPPAFLATATITVGPETRHFGFVLNVDDDVETGYIVRCEPARGRVVFNRCPADRKGRSPAVELEQPCALPPGQHLVQLLVDGTICTVCIDESVMLTARMYDFEVSGLQLMVADGGVVLEDLSLAVPTRG